MMIAAGPTRLNGNNDAATRPAQIIHRDATTHLPACLDGYTRFVLLSDTHTHTFPVPDGQVLIHAGDLTERGTVKELEKTINWLAGLPHPHKYIIAGNHDYCLDEETLASIRGYEGEFAKAIALFETPQAKKANLVYLKDQAVDIPVDLIGNNPSQRRKKWKLYGSPWSAAFCSMAFNVNRGQPSAELYAQIPDDTDILVTHGPPFGILDTILSGRNVGCTALRQRTKELSTRLHVWGHIHEDRGVIIGQPDEKESSAVERMALPTVFVNAANAGTFTRPRKWGIEDYQPIVVDLRNDVEESMYHI